MYWTLLWSLPCAFILSCVRIARWTFFKHYLLVNFLVTLIYSLIISYFTRGDLDGWGVTIFGLIAVYSHFIIGIAVALFIKLRYLNRV